MTKECYSSQPLGVDVSLSNVRNWHKMDTSTFAYFFPQHHHITQTKCLNLILTRLGDFDFEETIESSDK